MFFKNNKQTCPDCKSKFSEDYSFCPYCGHSMLNRERKMKDFGLLGKEDVLDEDMKDNLTDTNMTFIDKIVESTFNSLTKSMEKQMSNAMKDAMKMDNARVEQLPNGIKITIGAPQQAMPSQSSTNNKSKSQKKQISLEQMEKMSKLPRAQAKTNIRRLTDKIVYELVIPGLESLDDVFVSKLEKGYEIKAIGKRKIYANSLPIELPLHSFKLEKDKLFIEFKN